MLTILRNSDVYSPDSIGHADVLIAAGRVVIVAPRIPTLPTGIEVEEIDLGGKRLVPGFIDAHVHVTGGGGESGPASRVPPIFLSDLTSAGITSVVGVLGTDGTTRTVAELVSRTLALREEGLSAWCYTGSYQVPPITLTGSVRGDIAFVDPILGVGELAVSDHRSSQPTFDEFVRIAADCHVAGMMSGKAGVLHLHLGDGPRGLDLVRRAIDETEIPPRVFWPTHVNRNKKLFAEAIEITKRGCIIDITAFPADDSAYSAEDAVMRCLEAGVAPDQITVSSDGAGCLPIFDSDGRITSMDVGRPSSLFDAFRALVGRAVPLATALGPFTHNVARLLRLPRKGTLAAAADADFLVLDADCRVSDLMARGRWMVRGGKVIVRGTFEPKEKA